MARARPVRHLGVGRACRPDDTGVTEADVAAFIAELNQAFPARDLTLADVTLVHRGSRCSRHDASIDDRIDGLITVAGTKFTTAQGVAERVTDLVFKKLA